MRTGKLKKVRGRAIFSLHLEEINSRSAIHFNLAII